MMQNIQELAYLTFGGWNQERIHYVNSVVELYCKHLEGNTNPRLASHIPQCIYLDTQNYNFFSA